MSDHTFIYKEILKNSSSGKNFDLDSICKFGHVGILKEYLEINSEKINQDDYTDALSKVSEYSNYEDIIEILLDFGADPFSSFFIEGEYSNSFSNSMERGFIDSCKIMLKKCKNFDSVFLSTKRGEILSDIYIFYLTEYPDFPFFEIFKNRFPELQGRGYVFLSRTYEGKIEVKDFLKLLDYGLDPVKISYGNERRLDTQIIFGKEFIFEIIKHLQKPVKFYSAQNISEDMKKEIEEYQRKSFLRNIKGVKK